LNLNSREYWGGAKLIPNQFASQGFFESQKLSDCRMQQPGGALLKIGQGIGWVAAGIHYS
jgi:hypothetical protein